MRRYKYVGPIDVVELQDFAGNVIGTVERGKTIDVHDPEVADSLDEQDTWQHMPSRRAAKKADGSKAPARRRRATPNPSKASNPEPPTGNTDEE